MKEVVSTPRDRVMQNLWIRAKLNRGIYGTCNEIVGRMGIQRDFNPLLMGLVAS